jgi:hypothetical protein
MPHHINVTDIIMPQNQNMESDYDDKMISNGQSSSTLPKQPQGKLLLVLEWYTSLLHGRLFC